MQLRSGLRAPACRARNEAAFVRLFGSGRQAFGKPRPHQVGADTAGISRLQEVGTDLWMTKGYFNLGEGGTGKGLQYHGLRKRLLDRVHEDQDSQLGESTYGELVEEITALNAVQEGNHVPFELDTAMTIVRHGDNEIMLRSVVPFEEELAEEVRELGTVTSIVAASLQHWLFVPQWKEAFPNAVVFITPSALGEDLRDKLGANIGENAVELCDVIHGCAINGTPQISESIEQYLFRGAPLNMNETIMFHRPSRSLIVDDAFYGGYSCSCTTSWFARSWFKATKDGSFRGASLPSYRTQRVHTHGCSSELAATLDTLSKQWDFEQIVYTHGESLCTENAKDQFFDAWGAVLAEGEGKRIQEQQQKQERIAAAC